MRLILILFVLAFNTLNAQEILKDTIYFKNENDVLYRVTRIDYRDGSVSESMNPMTLNNALDIYSGVILTDAANTADYGRRFDPEALYLKAMGLNNAFKAATDSSLIKVIQNNGKLEFLGSDVPKFWNITFGEQLYDVEFLETETGQLTVKIGEDTQRIVVVLGKVIRINDFPTFGEHVYLFYDTPGFWRNIDSTVRLELIDLDGN